MAYLEASLLLWGLGSIQIVGLISAWLARFSEGSRRQSCCHRLFLGCLGLIGLTTMATLALGPKYWLPSGMTLSVMVLGAVWDFRPEARARTL
jgi:hypothetical protein